jgi:hypothetical protein
MKTAAAPVKKPASTPAKRVINEEGLARTRAAQKKHRAAEKKAAE